MNRNIEYWRPVVGYEGLYDVSSWGNVRSVDRYVKTKGNSIRLAKGVVLKPVIDKDGYLQVGLYKDGKRHAKTIHTLVAKAFIPNPENKPQVGHLKKLPDGTEDKMANEFWNLAWMTSEENNNFGTRNKRASEARINGKKSKKVYQYTLDGQLINIFPSTMEITRQLGFHRTSISRCCLGKQETSYGFKWSYNN